MRSSPRCTLWASTWRLGERLLRWGTLPPGPFAGDLCLLMRTRFRQHVVSPGKFTLLGPTGGAPLGTLARALTPRRQVDVSEAVLLEGQVLFRSTSFEHLSAVAEGITQLAFPLV